MSLEPILNRALAGKELEREDLARLARPAGQGERAAVRAAAREMRARTTGEAVLTYGFVYLSTYRRNDFRFCCYPPTHP